MSERTIVISGHYKKFPSIADSVADAFRRLGWTVFVHQFFRPIWCPSVRGKSRILIPRPPWHRNRDRRRLRELISEAKPDVILLLRGDNVDAEAVAELKSQRGFKLWQWMYDPISLTPGSLQVAKHCDKVFHYSHSDTLKLTKMFPGKDVRYLPGAFDDRFHRPGKNQSEKRDLFFCGALGSERYRNRRVWLNTISTLNAQSIGKFRVDYYFRPSNFNVLKTASFAMHLRRNYPLLYGDWKSRNLTRIDLVNEYHQSRLCLNLHSIFQDGMGLSWRTFELIGAGAAIVGDRHDDLAHCFDMDYLPMKIVSSPGEAHEVLAHLLRSSGSRRVLRDRCNAVRDKHTYYHRLKQMELGR